MIQATSLEAYKSIKNKLNERQTVVFDFIKQSGEVCNFDIAEGLGWPINSVTPRVLELRNMFLVESCSRRLSKSGRPAFFWRINPQIDHLKTISPCEKSLLPNASVSATVNLVGDKFTQGDFFGDLHANRN